MAQKKSITYLISSVFVFWIVTVLIQVQDVSADLLVEKWSPQSRIPVYDDLVLEPPQMVVDSYGTVHAFNGQWWKDVAVIMYRQWTLEQGWTTPVDIIIPPNSEIAPWNIKMGVSLDEAGIVHLVFTAGNASGANIYYTRAPLVNAGQSSAWSVPTVVGDMAIVSPPQVAMVGDGRGGLYVIYSGHRTGNGVYAVHSEDGGAHWSQATLLFLTYSDELWPSVMTIYMDSQETLHALWGVVGVTGLSEAVYYVRRPAGESEWSEPFEMARVIKFQADTPAIVEHEGELLVTFHNDEPTTSWMRRSTDGGVTWTEPVRFAPGYVGSNGAIDYVVDSSSTLHAFWGNRTGSPAVHGLWHRVWLGDQWSEIEAVVSGPQVVDEVGGAGFDPRSARSVISRGYIVLVTWTTDGFAGENGAWYSFTLLDTPRLPAKPLLTFPSLAPTPTATTGFAEATPTSQPLLPVQPDGGDVASLNSNPTEPLFIGVLSVFLLLGLIIMAFRIRSTHSS